MPNYSLSNVKKQKIIIYRLLMNLYYFTCHSPYILLIYYKEVGIKILIQPEHLPINHYCELHRYFCMIICLNQKKYILLMRKLKER